MLTILIQFLKSHWLGTLAGVAVAGVFTTISIQHMEIVHVRNQLKEYQLENVTLANSNKALMASLQNQNDAVLAFQAASAAKAKQAVDALTHAQADALKYRKAALAIEAAHVSKDECMDTKRLIDSFIAGAQ